ncbi:hypothetical protein KR018_006408 [Drosophila ironensis]|nr:hypothetical protein KR018_006408 [Drosophila ironensis]
MDVHRLFLCEIADDLAPETPELPWDFTLGKRRWRFKDFLTASAQELSQCIDKCEETRCRLLSFRAVKQQGSGLWSLALYHDPRVQRARKVELKMASLLLPLIFRDYCSSLEFQVAEQEEQHQLPLKTHATNKLYDALHERHLSCQPATQPEPLHMPDRFVSRLRNYQERTVLWMLRREQEPADITPNCSLLEAVDGKTRVFKHNYCLKFFPCTEEQLAAIRLPPGGILADEMGLGKTVEFLAMALLNPRPLEAHANTYWHEKLDDMEGEVPLKLLRKDSNGDGFCICTAKTGDRVQCTKCRTLQHKHCMNVVTTADSDEPAHLCPLCWSELIDASGQLVESGSTIIVSPKAIKMQWYREMKKHISPNLRVLLYKGLDGGGWFSPLELVKYDVVLTDYSVLRSEIYHTSEFKTDRQMRNQQLYIRANSPLLMVNWWRVCLDEAQMVESSTSSASEMVRKLPAINRWAVTGTIDDLPPLLEFVGRTDATYPKDAWQTMDKAFQMNYLAQPLLDVLQHSLWRTSKERVWEELGIPPMSEEIHLLELSNVEKLYYREEHVKCHELFLKVVNKHTRGNEDNDSCLASFSPQFMRSIMKPFLRIRQTCSVPVVQHGNLSTTNYLQPEDLLERLKASNESKCTSELRTWAASYNGLAAIHFIRKNYGEAIQYYKLMLKLAADYNGDNISVDSVQQIHAIFNLLEANKVAGPADKVSDADEQSYRGEMRRLEWKYLADHAVVLQSALEAYTAKLTDLEKVKGQYKGHLMRLLRKVAKKDRFMHNAMWTKVKEELIRQNISMEKLKKVKTINGLLSFVNSWYNKVETLNWEVFHEIEFMKDLMKEAVGAAKAGTGLSEDFHAFLNTVTACHLAQLLEEDKNKAAAPCRLCTIRESLNMFECLLFDKEMDQDSQTPEGMEKHSLQISIIKAIFAFVRPKPAFQTWKPEWQKELEVLACLQSIAKLQIKYWIEVEYMMKAFDELEMCKMRIVLTDNPEEQSNYRILLVDADEQMRCNRLNLQESQHNFARLCGRLKYLKHLKEDITEMPCPICQTQDDDRYVVMICGHFVCQSCLEIMKKNMDQNFGRCPTCRQDSPQLYYSVRHSPETSVAGKFSTKIANIVKEIQKIRAANDSEKIIIFSQWQAILFQISKALVLNGIKFRSKCTDQDFADFKNPNSKITCLLMPLSTGSKGLNLTEATHVFLVEPVLNPGDEKQAIGRIHRIGQTKPTKVHRFVVNGTIEENIAALIASADDSKTLSTHWDLVNMTMGSLKKLFILDDEL